MLALLLALVVALMWAAVFKSGLCLLIALGAAYRLFQKDVVTAPDNRGLGLYCGLLVALGGLQVWFARV